MTPKRSTVQRWLGHALLGCVCVALPWSGRAWAASAVAGKPRVVAVLPCQGNLPAETLQEADQELRASLEKLPEAKGFKPLSQDELTMGTMQLGEDEETCFQGDCGHKVAGQLGAELVLRCELLRVDKDTYGKLRWVTLRGPNLDGEEGGKLPQAGALRPELKRWLGRLLKSPVKAGAGASTSAAPPAPHASSSRPATSSQRVVSSSAAAVSSARGSSTAMAPPSLAASSAAPMASSIGVTAPLPASSAARTDPPPPPPGKPWVLLLVAERLAGKDVFAVNDPSPLLSSGKLQELLSAAPFDLLQPQGAVAAVDGTHLRAKGELRAGEAQRLAAHASVERVLFCKIVSVDLDAGSKKGVHKYKTLLRAWLVDGSTGKKLGEAQASHDIPCPRSDLTPNACRQMYVQQVLAPAVGQLLQQTASP